MLDSGREPHPVAEKIREPHTVKVTAAGHNRTTVARLEMSTHIEPGGCLSLSPPCRRTPLEMDRLRRREDE
ncbi:hypothetical protein BLNAU_17137 [Blattamonas nauphoetae]|uniref:Uncharacterized protein n=1 Tax=Blattamonas nauphoetae TaxID=2049346 RepID=A0ABQ9X9N3_9EUKA|nr:hypothetical protein BLNAU_17137 [Blattamonas nauphoetae]